MFYSNSNMAYRDVTAQFTMPFEYPMIFQITGKEKDFFKKISGFSNRFKYRHFSNR